MGTLTMGRRVIPEPASLPHDLPADKLFALAVSITRNRNLVTHAVVLGIAFAVSLAAVVS